MSAGSGILRWVPVPGASCRERSQVGRRRLRGAAGWPVQATVGRAGGAARGGGRGGALLAGRARRAMACGAGRQRRAAAAGEGCQGAPGTSGGGQTGEVGRLHGGARVSPARWTARSSTRAGGSSRPAGVCIASSKRAPHRRRCGRPAGGGRSEASAGSLRVPALARPDQRGWRPALRSAAAVGLRAGPLPTRGRVRSWWGSQRGMLSLRTAACI